MPEVKITELALASSVASTDLVVVVADPFGTPITKKTFAYNLPVSTPTQTALNLKANLVGPAFTSSPTSNTGTADTSSTQIATQAFVIGQAGTATPLINGSATSGTSSRYSRQDHVHATDTTRAPLASPTFTGIVTTAGQIAFPATPSLSSNANTLDDYEEGTFSLNWGAGASMSGYTQLTQYVKIGKTVWLQVYMAVTSNYSQSGANSGLAVYFTGLPYSPAIKSLGGNGSLSIGYQFGYTTRVLNAYILNGDTTIYLKDVSGNAITYAMLSATVSELHLTGYYTTTATT